ncbi:hypothetical protein Rs2_41316 [Raphanus sativus]|nr:hypothetical protein Rs2_41316 [Raphanus sativus]
MVFVRTQELDLRSLWFGEDHNEDDGCAIEYNEQSFPPPAVAASVERPPDRCYLPFNPVLCVSLFVISVFCGEGASRWCLRSGSPTIDLGVSTAEIARGRLLLPLCATLV